MAILTAADLEALPRLVFGLAFILLALLDIGDSSAIYDGNVPRISQLAASGWILPLCTLMFVVLAVVEYSIWLLSYYSARKRVTLQAVDSQEKELSEEPTEMDERAPERETLARIEMRLERARTERSVARRTHSQTRSQSLGAGPGFLPNLNDSTG